MKDEEILEKYYSQMHAYYYYLNIRNGTWLQEGLKPDPVDVDKAQAAWVAEQTEFDKLGIGPVRLRELLQSTIKSGYIKRKKK